MPKINELTNRPGGLQPTDEIWVADGATADFKINGSNLLSFIAANLSTVAFPVETWTPTILGSSTNPTVAYTLQVGYYVRLGNLVYVSARLVWGSLSGGSGNARFSLPIAGAGNNEFSEMLPGLPVDIEFPAGVTSAVLRVRPGGVASADLLGIGDGLSTTSFGLSHLGGSGSISFSGVYRV